jgi:methionine sulfoxide reductase heme-binding subunit
MKDASFHKLLVFVNGLVPLAFLGWDAYHHQLGANPTEFATRTTGVLTLVFLTLSLAVTPLRKVFGQPWMARVRRMLGLFSFGYGTLHLCTYLWFDKAFQWPVILADIGKRPFITVGMATFLILLPLAITSNNRVIRWMGGQRWNKLHKLAYLAGILGVVHYYMLVKADTRVPLAFGGALAILLGYRLLNRWFPRWTEWPSPKPKTLPH